MVRRYRIQPERHTVAIHNLEGGSWRNAAGVPTCSALTDEGERSPFLHASCEKYPTVERIDSRGQCFERRCFQIGLSDHEIGKLHTTEQIWMIFRGSCGRLIGCNCAGETS